MDEKIKELYGILNDSKDFRGIFSSPEVLAKLLTDDTKIDEFYNTMNESKEFKGIFKDSETFKSSFGLQKKKRNFWTRCFHFCFGQRGTSFLGSVRTKLSQSARLFNSTTTINIG